MLFTTVDHRDTLDEYRNSEIVTKILFMGETRYKNREDTPAVTLSSMVEVEKDLNASVDDWKNLEPDLICDHQEEFSRGNTITSLSQITSENETQEVNRILQKLRDLHFDEGDLEDLGQILDV